MDLVHMFVYVFIIIFLVIPLPYVRSMLYSTPFFIFLVFLYTILYQLLVTLFFSYLTT